MKLYRVEYHGEVMVVANNQQEALEVADRALQDDIYMVAEDLGASFAVEVNIVDHLASGWDVECRPFGSDTPIKEYL